MFWRKNIVPSVIFGVKISQNASPTNSVGMFLPFSDFGPPGTSSHKSQFIWTISNDWLTWWNTKKHCISILLEMDLPSFVHCIRLKLQLRVEIWSLKLPVNTANIQKHRKQLSFYRISISTRFLFYQKPKRKTTIFYLYENILTF